MATEAERAYYTKLDGEFVELLKTLPPAPPMAGELAVVRAAMTERNKRKNETSKLTFDLSGVDEKDIHIPSRDNGSIPARVYWPQAAPSGGGPLVMMMHGGGFCLGDVENEQLNCRLFAKNFGAVCLNVVYRLAPEHPFPAAPNDSWDALKWIAANATSKLGADPSKGFIVGGTSAGGNLTDVVAHLARDEKLSPPLTGLLEIIPALCPYNVMPEKYQPFCTSYIDNQEAPVLPQKTIDFFMDNFKPDYHSPLHAPFNWPGGHSGLPPVCFMVCGADPLRDEALVYEKVLREEYGIKTKLTIYPGLPHGFWGFFPTMKKSANFVKDTSDCLRWLLEQKGQ